jgi:hypothetical protein
MMFGCRAAANWAQRGTGLLAWLLQKATDRIVPASKAVRSAYQHLLRTGAPKRLLQLASVHHYIDDVPVLTLRSEQEAVEMVMASLWKTLGVEPQGKKVWPEGGFESQ